MNPKTNLQHIESKDDSNALPLPVQMGKYEIAARPLPLENGGYAARVSIASRDGGKQAAHELSFHDEFPNRAAAAYFAMSHGLRWALKSLRAGSPKAVAA